MFSPTVKRWLDPTFLAANASSRIEIPEGKKTT
jgi:hypothetical protein